MEKDKIIVIGAGDIGKTTLAEKIARQTNSDVVVVEDVGEMSTLLKGKFNEEAVYAYENVVKPYENIWAVEMTKRQMNAPLMEPVRSTPKIYNNEPCPCGSGKKYKKCCK